MLFAGTDKEFAEAGKQAIVAVPHTLSYGPQDWLINKTSDFKVRQHACHNTTDG